MKRLLLTALAAICLLSSPAGTSAKESTFYFDPFGTVRLYQGKPRTEGIVLFISGDGGWNQGVAHMAEHLSHYGVTVAGIDIRSYLHALNASREPCVYPAADFEALSKYLQKKLDLPQYTLPVLAGFSSGATLVYAVLAQSPPNTFQGGISLSFCTELKLHATLCRARGLVQRDKGRDTILLPVDHALAAPWIVLQGAIDKVCGPGAAQSFVRRVPGAEFELLPKVGHGFSVYRNWMPRFQDAYSRVAQGSRVAVVNSGPIKDLPLIEVPVRDNRSPTFAVILSGDGGWAGLDREVGNALAAKGVPVVGLNSLQYFWKKRTPSGASADLERILRHYFDSWHEQSVILIGYSLGADVLPFMANRLPADLLSRVSEIALLGPGKKTQFEFHFSEWLGRGDESDSMPVQPEVERLRGRNILCLYGADEKESLCPGLERTLAELIVMPGGHHFGGMYNEIADMILKASGRKGRPE